MGAPLGASLPFQHDQHSVLSDLAGCPGASSEFTPPDLKSVIFLPRSRPSLWNAAPLLWAEVPEKLRCPGPFSLTRTLWTSGMTLSAAKFSFAVNHKLYFWYLFFLIGLGLIDIRMVYSLWAWHTHLCRNPCLRIRWRELTGSLVLSALDKQSEEIITWWDEEEIDH